MSNDSTGKTGPLSLADRHKQGLLGDDMELPLSEVMELEFPGEQMMRGMWTPEYTRWQGLIVAACRFGLLGKDEKTRGVWCIPRDAYRTWRTSQPEPPTGSFISLWLGATPAVETLPPAEPIPPALPTLPAEQTATTARPAEPSIPEPIAKGGAAEKIVALLALLDEVDKRAKEQDKGFNRHSLPGTKKEFHALAIEYNRRAFAKALSTFDGYLEGNCQFNCNGAKPEQGKGADIWALFPEYKPRLG